MKYINAMMATLILLLVPVIAQADTLDSGDTAWILTSTALVLFMTLPGLALFYGGLVRAKNVLSVLVQCFVIACVVSAQTAVIKYAFGKTYYWFQLLDLSKYINFTHRT